MFKIDAESIKDNSGVNLMSYSNGLEYNKTELSQEISTLGNSLSSIIINNYSYVNEINFQHIFQKISNTDEVCKLIIYFKIYNIADRYEMDIPRDGTYTTKLSEVLNLILDGCYAINIVNTKIKEIQNSNSASVAIAYKWGILDTCSINDWDYDTIKIKLSKIAILHIIELIQSEDYLNSLIEKNKWDYTLKEYIENFDKIELHKAIDAILESDNLEEILLKNMVQAKDISTILKSKEFNSNLEIKVVTNIKELGNFLVISRWYIDSSKHIRVDIIDNKILDLDNGKMIINSDLVDRVYNKISKDAELIAKGEL